MLVGKSISAGVMTSTWTSFMLLVLGQPDSKVAARINTARIEIRLFIINVPVEVLGLFNISNRLEMVTINFGKFIFVGKN